MWAHNTELVRLQVKPLANQYRFHFQAIFENPGGHSLYCQVWSCLDLVIVDRDVSYLQVPSRGAIGYKLVRFCHGVGFLSCSGVAVGGGLFFLSQRSGEIISVLVCGDYIGR